MATTRAKLEVLQMRFEDIYGRYDKRELTTEEAAEILGISARTFLRKRTRYESGGIDGLLDLRLGKPSPRRAESAEIARITKLYADKYKGFTVKHFHEFACRDHGLTYGYTWTKTQLEEAGHIRRGKKGGDHRLRRERKPRRGMMLHQDGSTHDWIPGLGHNLDLIVTMDDADSEITSAFFVLQEGTDSSFEGVKETIEKYGLFLSLYTDRGSHYWTTPEAGGRVDKQNLTQFGRAMKQLGITLKAAYSPQARGRSERMFGTLQKRLPNELRLVGITTIDEANKYLREVYLPRHNKQFTVKPKIENETAYIPWIGGDLDEILCHQEERTVQNDNTISYKGICLQIPKDDMRHHYVRTDVEVRQYPNGEMGVFFGNRCLGRYDEKGIIKEVSPILRKAA